MEDSLLTLLKKIEHQNEVQEQLARKSYAAEKLRTAFAGGLLLVVLACAAVFGPKLFVAFREVNSAMSELETVLGNLEEVSQELPGMLDNMNGFMENSQEDMSAAIEKISGLDIETLNKAIGNLHTVVEPLAKLFGRE